MRDPYPLIVRDKAGLNELLRIAELIGVVKLTPKAKRALEQFQEGELSRELTAAERLSAAGQGPTARGGAPRTSPSVLIMNDEKKAVADFLKLRPGQTYEVQPSKTDAVLVLKVEEANK